MRVINPNFEKAEGIKIVIDQIFIDNKTKESISFDTFRRDILLSELTDEDFISIFLKRGLIVSSDSKKKQNNVIGSKNG